MRFSKGIGATRQGVNDENADELFWWHNAPPTLSSGHPFAKSGRTSSRVLAIGRHAEMSSHLLHPHEVHIEVLPQSRLKIRPSELVLLLIVH